MSQTLNRSGIDIEESSDVPYERLWKAVLGLALNDAVDWMIREKWNKAEMPTPLEVDNLEMRTAFSWISDPNNHPGSFIWVCDMIGFYPETVKMKIMKAVCDGVRKT